MIGFPVSKDTRCSFVVWIARFVFVSDAETDDSKFPVGSSFDEISDARSNSTRKFVHEAILMKLLCIRAV